MVGRQLPFFSVIVPFWLIAAFAGSRGMLAIWPAVLVAGVSFAVPQFLVSNYHGPWLVDVVAAVVLDGRADAVPAGTGIRGTTGWRPAISNGPVPVAPEAYTRQQIMQAWTPWVILSVLVFVWGLPQMKAVLDGISALRFHVPELHNLVYRVPPVVPEPRPEAAIFVLNWLSATGSGHFRVGHPGRPRDGLSRQRDDGHLLAHVEAGPLLAGDDRGDDGGRLYHALFGRRRHAGPGLRGNRVRSIRSSARCSDGSASR